MAPGVVAGESQPVRVSSAIEVPIAYGYPSQENRHILWRPSEEVG